jgi:hypothetical protein
MGGTNPRSIAHISALIPKCSLNLLSLVFKEKTPPVLERVPTNVAANVQKRAGSTGIGIVVAVDDEAFVGAKKLKSFCTDVVFHAWYSCTEILRWCEKIKIVLYRCCFLMLGTVVRRSYIKTKKKSSKTICR